MSENDLYLRSSDVAQVLKVSPKTVTRWANQGLLPSTRTLGGHRRFLESDISAIARELQGETPGETSGDHPAEAPGGEG